MSVARPARSHAEVGRLVSAHGPDYVDVVASRHPGAEGDVRFTAHRDDSQRIERLTAELRSLGFASVVQEPSTPPGPIDFGKMVREPLVMGCARCHGPAIAIPIPPDYTAAPLVCPACSLVAVLRSGVSS